jgi:hypothetical protein
MDPDETLRALRAELHAVHVQGGVGDAHGNRIVELFYALDGWLSSGGFLPDAWWNCQDERPC